MIILTYLFYSFAAVFIIWETVRFFGFNQLKFSNELSEKFKEEKEYNEKVEAATVGDEFFLKDKKWEAAVNVVLFAIFSIAFNLTYWLWTILGLTTSQWFAFLALIIVSFIYAGVQKLVGSTGIMAEIALRIDAAISIIILIFILINRFQLGWTI